MWKLSVEDDQGNKTSVNLVRGEYTIGRAQENTVRLTERNISRRHAMLRKNGDGWNIEDQSSYNGCFVNGARVCDVHPLEHGDLVQLGDYRLRVIDESADFAEDQTPTARAQRASPAPAAAEPESTADRLIMIAGPTPGVEFALEAEQVLVGRGEECDISINHTSVSRVHAEIHRVEDGRYEIIDSDSANGVRINGNDLRRSLLESHDSIELGDITLKLVLAGEEYVPPPDAIESAAEQADLDVTASGPAGSVAALLDRVPLTRRQLQIAGGAAAALLVVVVGIAALSGGDESSTGTTPGTQLDDAARALIEAKSLLEQGEVEAAHRMAVTGVPERSSLRDSHDFKTIETRWADEMLAHAAAESDPDAKRALLDRVARATTVDSVRRKRAADELSLISTSGVDISDLPQARRMKINKKPDKPPPAPGDEVTADFDADEAAPAPRAVAAAPTPSPAPRAADDNPYAEPAPAPKAKPAGGTKDKATSGERAAQIAAKDALKAKVRSGRASDQEKRLLRALCRQYNDPSCM